MLFSDGTPHPSLTTVKFRPVMPVQRALGRVAMPVALREEGARMPIGVFTGVFGILAVATLASGLFLLLQANAVARVLEKPDNDVVSGRARPPGRRARPRSVKAAAAVFALGTLGLGVLIILYASGIVSDAAVIRTDPTVQRP